MPLSPKRLLTPEQRGAIGALRSDRRETLRATVPALEEALYEPFSVLDHGFVRVIDYMGDDAAVAQAARVSYGRGTKSARDDQGLINYLMRNGHTSPFEMCEIKLHVKLPIFVARQWIRHRTANVNEYSARYSVLDKEFYVPAPEQLAAQSEANRQGRASAALEADRAKQALDLLRADAERVFAHYYALLNEAPGEPGASGEAGLARELARIGLPLSSYTQWYWKTDLHNLLRFLALRNDVHAQWEIRQYAGVILDLVKLWTPLVAAAFHNYRVGGAQLSAEGLRVVKRMLAGETVDPSTLEMSPREWRELRATLGLDA